MSAGVLVIDMQNGFLHPKGSSATHGMYLDAAPEVIAATAEMLTAARAGGLPIVYLRHVYRPGLIDMPARLAAVWPRDPEPVVRGTWDAEIVDELAPLPDDNIVEKNRFDAFLYTELQPLLYSLRADKLLVAGCVTSICVETSVRSAAERGFDCFVAEDCTAGFGGTHAASLSAMALAFATVGPWRDLLATLSSAD